MDAKDKMLQELDGLIVKGQEIERKTTIDTFKRKCCVATDFYAWKSEILTLLQNFNLDHLIYYTAIYDLKKPVSSEIFVILQKDVSFVVSQLKCLRSQIEKDLVGFGEVNTKSSLSDLENIFDKFHRV